MATATATSFNCFAAKEPMLQLSHLFRSAPSSPCSLVAVSRRERLFSTILRKSSVFSVEPINGKSGPLGFRAAPFLCRVAVVADSPASVDGEVLEIAGLGIDRSMVSALAKRGIHELFPIQKAVLEPAMQGRDMIGRAKTGTGKTLAFGIPIMDKIIQFNAKNGRGRTPLALVMAPTRELATQVEKEFRMTAPGLVSVCCYGGVPIMKQMRDLRNGVDVVVGTPGRIIDLLERGNLDLSQVQFVVLDEADLMLAVGFEEAVETILQQLPRQRQSMMFSATMPPSIRNLTRKYLKDPLTIDLVGDSDQKLAEGISLFSIASHWHSKASILGPLITEHAKGGKSIVFTRTKRDADELAYAMAHKYRCKALHGDISQSQRERTLSGFRDGRFNILIATDVASRGLDIPNVDLVVHYELPNTSEIFVHRSGRTGRAGKKGSAIIMYTNNQTRDIKVIEREVGCRFTELPSIKGESGDMLDGMGGGSQFGSYGGSRDRRGGEGSSYSSGQGGSRFGRSSSGYGRSSGSSSGRLGRYDESGSGRSRGGGSRFGSSSGYGRSSGSSSGRVGRYDESGSDRSGGGGSRFGSSGGYGRSSGSSSGRKAGFGEYGSNRSGSSRGSGSGQSGGFGGSKSLPEDIWDFLGKKDSSRGSGSGDSRDSEGLW